MKYSKKLIAKIKLPRSCFAKIEPFNEYLFVYGSLKKGFDNHKLLEKYARRIGKASTVAKFGMFEAGFGNYPYLIQKSLNTIKGELYQITRKELLARIDEFEGAPEYYERKKIKVKSHRGIVKAFVYIRPAKEVPIGQKSLKVWQNDTDYKVQNFNSFLNRLHQMRATTKRITARALHDSIASIDLGSLDSDMLASLQELNTDTNLLLTCKADYDLDPSLAGCFWEDMAKIEKIFMCCKVDIEKEFPKKDIQG